MIVSRGRGYVFVHIPKTGGTALALALEGRAMADDIMIGDTPKARRRRRRIKGVATRGRLWKHARLADAEGLVTREEMTQLFVFTLVRNPWDRIVSYYHWLRAQEFDHRAVTLAKRLELADFIAHPHTANTIRANPYGRYVRDPDGVERADLFLRIEHLETDIGPLETHLGFRLAPLARANASDRARDWRVYYTDAAAERVATLCAEDIARFGYGFDG